MNRKTYAVCVVVGLVTLWSPFAALVLAAVAATVYLLIVVAIYAASDFGNR